jgi:anti-anti-sigma factor
MTKNISEPTAAEVASPEVAADRLTVVRLPGEYGPVVRCSGELTAATAETLRREVERLEPMGHPVLTVNLTGCDFIDVDGLMVLLDGYRQLRQSGRRLALVAEGGVPARLLQALQIDTILPVFPREEVAARALRGGGPHPLAPATWTEARQKTLQRWRTISETLERDPEEALRLMTSMFALCDRAEELFEEQPGRAEARCQFCPLFQALGGHQEDLGCRSVLEPLIDAVRAGERSLAQTKIGELTRLIAQLPAPEEIPTPFPVLPSPETGSSIPVPGEDAA